MVEELYSFDASAQITPYHCSPRNLSHVWVEFKTSKSEDRSFTSCTQTAGAKASGYPTWRSAADVPTVPQNRRPTSQRSNIGYILSKTTVVRSTSRLLRARRWGHSLAAYLPETSSITPNQAAEQVNALLPCHRPKPKEEICRQSTTNFLFEFWELMFRVAQQLDHRHEPMQRFVFLVKALENLPETIVVPDGDGGIYDGKPVWRGHGPYFNLTLHERWNQIPEHRAPEDLHAFRWRNVNGLLAYFSVHNVSTNDFHAFASITDALEEYQRKKPKTPINHRVPAAAIWFVLCPSIIYLACQEHRCADSKLSGKLWKGEPQQGYSISRWDFWRKSFGGVGISCRCYRGDQGSLQGCHRGDG